MKKTAAAQWADRKGSGRVASVATVLPRVARSMPATHRTAAGSYAGSLARSHPPILISDELELKALSLS